MKRRSFLKTAAMAVAAAPVTRLVFPGLDYAAQTRRIAFGGISIECSTYSRIRARVEDFTVLRGDALAADQRFSFLKQYPYAFLPTLVATAVPGGPVDTETYKTLKAEFLQRLKVLLPLDGLYLPMHGAMFVEGMQDAEGDWISSAREVVGKDCLLSASYDLHGNVSKRVADNLDMFSAFRTAPHIDRQETMERACNMLVHSLESGIRPAIVWAPIPVLMPGERSSTLWEPGKRLWAQLPAMNREPGILDVSLLVGYVWADEPRATASAVITGTNLDAQKEVALDLAAQYWNARKEFQFGTWTGTIAQCVERAQQAETQPVILADSGDNPTGGGTGDRAEVLAELLRVNFQNAVFAGIVDRPATEACYQAGVGDVVPLKVGASLDPTGSVPVNVRARVIFLLPAEVPSERQAVVQVQGVKLVLTARRRPFHDIVDFTSLGLEPKSFKLIVVKSGYLSPDLAPLANPSLMALSDGAINQDIVHLPKNRYRIPTYPFVADLHYRPFVIVSERTRKL